ncbi:MAG: CPBP family intramembrane metalloprotease [Clostridia bacterium]|nr:CPBP family intramembrane metalloprotease [Clostridia bacterium]
MRKYYRFRDGSLGFAGVLLANMAVLVLMSIVVYVFTEFFGYSSTGLYTNMWIIYLNSFLCELAFFLLFIIYNKIQKIDFFTASRISFKFDKKIGSAVAGLALIVLFASLNFTNMFNYFASTFSSLSPSGSVPLDNIWQLLLSIVLFAVVPAVSEELVFRGIIYNAMRRKFGAKLSILLSAVVFVIIHFSIYQTVHQLIIGIVLGCLVYFTGSIVYGMIFHFVNNLFVLLLTYFSSAGAFFTFSSFGAMEIILTISILAVGVVAVIFFFVFLFSYTKKHKNYLNLEKSSKKIEPTDKNEVAQAQETRVADITYFVLIMAVCLIIWLFNSFGG